MMLGLKFLKTLPDVVRLYLAPLSLNSSLLLSSPALSLSSSLRIGGNVRATATYKNYEKNKYMQKLLFKKGAKTRKHWYKPYLGEALEVETKKTKRTVSHSHNIRLRQLSHVLYDKVIDIINTGELSQEMLDKQVSITAVTVTKDVNSINIFWEADRKDWKEVEELLASHSGKLRSLLISYHVLGRVPHIVFVKDKSPSNLHELTELFEKADYGPDYVHGVNNAGAECDVEFKDDLEDPRDIESNLDNLILKDESNYDLNQSSTPRTTWNLDDLYKQFNNSQFSRIDHSYSNTKSKPEEAISVHVGEEKINGLNDGLINGNNDNSNAISVSEPNTSLNFRSDLYGLDRAGMMRKILVKKTKASNQINDRLTNEFVGLKESSMPCMDLNIDPKDMPTLVSPFLTKIKLQKKLLRNEKKLQKKMLERDFDHL